MKEVNIPNEDWLMNFIDRNEMVKQRNIGTEIPGEFKNHVKIFHSIYVKKENQHLQFSWDEVDKFEKEPTPKIETIKCFEDLLKIATVVGIGTPDDLITSKEKYQRILWEELCNKENLEFKKTISPSVFQKHFEESFPIWLCGPNEGSLDQLETSELIRGIVAAKGNEEEYYFHFDWLKSGLIATRDLENANIRFKGKLDEIMMFFDYDFEETNISQLPTYIWNESKDLFIWSDSDLAFTFIACDEQVADHIMNSKLESVLVDKDFEYQYDKY